MDHLFIVGVGRSGTTLIQSILNAHSKVAFTPETHFLYNYLRPGASHQSPKNRQELTKLLEEDSYLQRLDIDWENVLGNISYEEEVFEQFFKKYLEQYAQKEGVQIIGDKDPMNSGLLPLINKFFPKAYIIHIIRDPRDVLLSRLKSDWGKKYPLIAHLGDHKVSLEKALKEGPELFGARYIECRYEDLIENPKEEIQRISTPLPIDFEEGMLQFSESSAKLVSDEEKKWKKNIFGTIMSTNKNKWKKELSLFQKNMCSLLLGDLIDKLGYEGGQNPPFYLFPINFVFPLIENYFKRKYRLQS